MAIGNLHLYNECLMNQHTAMALCLQTVTE